VKKRNGGFGAGLISEKSPIVPIVAGAGGAVVASLAAEKLGLSPNIAAWGTAAIGAATALGTQGVVRQVAVGVGAAGACLGAISLFSSARAEAAKKDQQKQADQKKRQADGDTVTRAELNEALASVADQHKQQCDLITALHSEIRKVVAAPQNAHRPQPIGMPGPPWTWNRGADGADEYTRNAYGGEIRNADEYMHSAYGTI
jgi:hypothetical protein